MLFKKSQSPYVVRDGFFVKTDEKWEKVRYDEILWVRAFENGSVVFLTDGKSLMVNHRLWRIEEMLQEHKNFVRINRSEIVNLDAVDGFEGNCYYIGKNPLYATGDYRQRMEGVFVKAKQLDVKKPPESTHEEALGRLGRTCSRHWM
jgi:hypothetical protein